MRWVFIAAASVVAATQAYSCFAQANSLNHLTNWAWLLSGACAATYAIARERPPLWLYALVLGTALFVAAGITALMVMDGLMVSRYADEMGVGLVWTANVLLHYVPLLWLLLLPEERKRAATRKSEAPRKGGLGGVLLLAQVNLLPALFVLLYGTTHDARAEYPGTNVDFIVLYAAGVAAQAFGGALLLGAFGEKV
jgi:hypothetical protein